VRHALVDGVRLPLVRLPDHRHGGDVRLAESSFDLSLRLVRRAGIDDDQLEVRFGFLRKDGPDGSPMYRPWFHEGMTT
jgi:hypothetical protein